MAVHPPRRRQLLPPSPQEQARRAEEATAWRAEHDRREAERATLDIADGEDDDLTGPDGRYDLAHALTVAVHAVRTFLARRGCEHQQPTDPTQLFCSWCGVRLAEADEWTTA